MKPIEPRMATKIQPDSRFVRPPAKTDITATVDAALNIDDKIAKYLLQAMVECSC